MAFVTANGIALPVKEFSRVYDRSHKIATAFDGTPIKTERYRKRRWEGKTSALTLQEAEALIALLDGLGDSWSLGSSLVYTGKGVAPGGTFTANVSGGVHEGDVDVLSGNSLTINVGTYSRWTLLHFKDGSHYAWDNSGNDYVNGTLSGVNIGNWASYSSGVLTLQGKGITGVNANTAYEDIYFIPAKLTAAQIAEWYALNSSDPFPELPKINLDGDAVDNLTTNVVGEVMDVVPFQAYVDGSLTQVYEVSFALREV